MRSAPLAAAALVLATATTARAELIVDRAVIVGQAGPAAPWTDAPTEARVADGATLAVVVIAHDRAHPRTPLYIADPDLAQVSIAGHRISAAARRSWDALGAVAIRWSAIEPLAWHAADERASNGNTAAFHSNVSTEARDFGRWLGYDQLRYFATPLADWSDAAPARRLVAAIVPHEPDAASATPGGAGTMRYQVLVRTAATTVASPGIDAVDEAGILPSVHRVSLRTGDDFLGRLSGYFLVPEVFGSAGGGRNHQTERYTGADCADIMVGALRRTGRAIEYTNVAGLPALTTVVAGSTELDDAGRPAHVITGVRPGDLIRIDYGGTLRHHTPRDWDHVAALWEDRSDPAGPHHGGPDGALDGFDLVVHMGHPRLVVEPLAQQAPATIDVLRWRATSSAPGPARTSR
jgi:hypothetical protein